MCFTPNPNEEQFEMFGNRADEAVWPGTGTLARELLDRLLTGERVAQPNFHKSWRLAAYALDLRRFGWPVQDELIRHPLMHRTISRYFFTPDAILSARNRKGGTA